MSNLKDKIAIVTGGSKGIGAAIAKTLADHGATVVINHSNSKELADNVVAEIIRKGGQAYAIQGDVANVQHVTQLFDQTIEKYGKVDILVNNAGIQIIKPIKDITDEELNRQMDVNFKGVFYALREAATKMQDNGNIINLSSVTTKTINVGYSIYTASKGAVEQLTRNFAKEMAERNITVNTVSPGPTETELFTIGKSDEIIKNIASRSVFNRLGKPEEIADLVAFLAGPESKWITAQNIGSNGGMV